MKMPPAKRRRHKGSFLFDRNSDFNGSVGIEDCVITASRPIFVNSIITEYPIRVNAFPLPPRYIPAPHGEGLPPPVPHGAPPPRRQRAPLHASRGAHARRLRCSTQAPPDSARGKRPTPNPRWNSVYHFFHFRIYCY